MSHPIASASSSTHDQPSTNSDDSDDPGLILKPRPRAPFSLSSPPSTPPSDQSSLPHTKEPTLPTPSHLQAPTATATMDSSGGTTTPSRTRSFLNLTSSTLFGIYQPTGYAAERDDSQPPTWGAATPWSGSTPWGTGAQTPAERSPLTRENSMDWSRATVPESAMPNGGSAKGAHKKDARRRRSVVQRQRVHQMPRRGFKGFLLPLLARGVTLFVLGVGYALLITHLHDRRGVAPVRVELDRGSWTYLSLWGIAGVLLGEALPWADRFWTSDPHNEDEHDDSETKGQTQRQGRKESGLDGWMDVIRSIGAFVGIAFAIRKLPWQSTTQLSLTLALANPALWYLIDRSPPGFILSTIVALTGTVMLLVINPALMPSPSPVQLLRGVVAKTAGSAAANASANTLGTEELVLGVFSPESVGVATWIASVFFVSSVCFGNIGRRLAREADA